MPCTATRSPAQVTHRIENCNPGAQQRRGFIGRKIIGHGRDRFGGDHDILCVAAIVTEASNLLELAENEMAPAARVAGKAMSAVPADADPLSGLPLCDVRSDCVDAPGNLMAGDARILQTGEAGLLYEEVTVTNAARFNLDSNLGAARLRNRALHDFKIATRLADLGDFHSFDPQECGVMR